MSFPPPFPFVLFLDAGVAEELKSYLPKCQPGSGFVIPSGISVPRGPEQKFLGCCC